MLQLADADGTEPGARTAVPRTVQEVVMGRVDLNLDLQEAKRHGWDQPPRRRANASLD